MKGSEGVFDNGEVPALPLDDEEDDDEDDDDEDDKEEIGTRLLELRGGLEGLD